MLTINLINIHTLKDTSCMARGQIYERHQRKTSHHWFCKVLSIVPSILLKTIDKLIEKVLVGGHVCKKSTKGQISYFRCIYLH